jgi:hypothetical protein
MKTLLAAALLLGAVTGRAAAEPALWVVQGPIAKIYLFGTMHILPKPVDWFGPKISTAFADSKTLFEEADIGMVQPQVLSRIMNAAVSPDVDLWQLLPDKSAAKFRDLVRACHLPANVVAHFRPWFAAMLPTTCQVMTLGDNAAKHSPEAKLLAEAKAHGTKTDFFETADEQIALLAGMPEKVQLAELEQAIDEGGDDLDDMEQSWSNGDVSALTRLVLKARADDDVSYQAIFVQRNKRFAARIETLLHGHENVFVAIGAGHFAGPDSVQAQLAQRGWVAKRL